GAEGRTVDLHQEPIAPAALLMNGPGDKLLSRARFAQDKDGAVRLGDLADQPPDRAHGGAVAGERAQVTLVPAFVLEIAGFAGKARKEVGAVEKENVNERVQKVGRVGSASHSGLLYVNRCGLALSNTILQMPRTQAWQLIRVSAA